jgi:predicted nucleic acid-binding protein
MVIVDTSVWIDYLADTVNAETAWLERELSLQRIGLTDLILCEVLQGIRHDRAFRETRQKLCRFEILDCGGEDAAVEAAQNFRILRAKGCTVRKAVNCMIATCCLRGGHSLLHRDRDFDHFEKHLGLPVVHPPFPYQ